MSAPCQSACSPYAEPSAIPTRCREIGEPEEQLQALADATDILFLMSGRQYPGFCRDVVRPCSRSRYGSPSGIGVGALVPDQWSNRSWTGWCSCNWSADQCGCSHLSEITLGVFPVAEIEEVKLDGQVLDEAEYKVQDFMHLVRLADENGDAQGWPCCQRMDLPSTEVGTFEVTVVYGSAPPGNAAGAAAALACQLLRGRNGDNCDLPSNVTSIARQGVSLNLQGVVSLLDTGRTGVYEADLWLDAVNPAEIQRPGGVLVPGGASSVRRQTS